VVTNTKTTDRSRQRLLEDVSIAVNEEAPTRLVVAHSTVTPSRKRRERRNNCSKLFIYSRERILQTKAADTSQNYKVSSTRGPALDLSLQQGLTDANDGDAMLESRVEAIQHQVSALEWRMVELSGEWGPFQTSPAPAWSDHDWDSSAAWQSLQEDLAPALRIGPSSLRAETVEVHSPARKCTSLQDEFIEYASKSCLLRAEAAEYQPQSVPASTFVYDETIGAELDDALVAIFDAAALRQALLNEPICRQSTADNLGTMRPTTVSADRPTVYSNPCEKCQRELQGGTRISFCIACERIRGGSSYRH
jgi:hypothetical protein